MNHKKRSVPVTVFQKALLFFGYKVSKRYVFKNFTISFT